MWFDILLACDINGVIGRENKLPWSFSTDMAFFKKKTQYTDLPNFHNVVIMGKNTYNSVKFLQGRINIVVSRSLYNENMEQFSQKYDTFNDAIGEPIFVDNFQHALTIAMVIDYVESVYVIGGAQLYSEAFAHPLCRYLYLTEIANEYEGDVFINRSEIYNEFEVIKYSQSGDIDRFQGESKTLVFKKMVNKNYSTNLKSVMDY